jgi:hypothetical protein
MQLVASLKVGSPLVPGRGNDMHHRLDGRRIWDGEIIEVLTDVDWISGHYRPELHPETGAVKFDLHVATSEGEYEHVTIYLPENSLFRRAASPTH